MTTELVELAERFEALAGALGNIDPDGGSAGYRLLGDAYGEAEEIAAAIRALASRAGVPDGFVLVPLVLTDEMAQAGHKAQWDVEPDGELHGDKTISLNAIYRRIYAAQIAAAPEPVAVGSNNLSNDEENV